MSALAHFAAYAAAFEEAYRTDDWTQVRPFFREDAVYVVGLDPPMGGRFEGRDAILAYFKRILDAFDRRFESREIGALEGPTVDGDTVWLRGHATYRAAGVPELVLVLEETVRFDGDRIAYLEDAYEPTVIETSRAYLDAHGRGLGVAL